MEATAPPTFMKKIILFFSFLLSIAEAHSVKINDDEYRFCVMDDATIHDTYLDLVISEISKLSFTSSPKWLGQNGTVVLSGNGYGDNDRYAQVVFTQPYDYDTKTYDNYSLSHRYVVTWKSGGQTSIASKAWVKVDAPSGIRLKGLPQTMCVGSTGKLSSDLLGSYTPFSGGGYFDIVYKSSDPEIAAISSYTVTAKKAGVVTITVTARARNHNYPTSSYLIGQDTFELVVTEKPEPTEITLSTENVVIDSDGTAVISYTLSPSDAKNDVEWKSGDTNIVTVSANSDVSTARLRGVARGKTFVDVTTSNGLSARCNVTVVAEEDYQKVTIGDYCLDLNKDDLSATIIKYNKTSKENTAIIPSEVECYGRTFSVKSIGTQAFKDAQLSYIDIPDNITEIGDDAFMTSTIESAYIGSGLQNIGYAPFNRCMSLKSIYVSDTNTHFASYEGALYNKDFSVLFQMPYNSASFSLHPDLLRVYNMAFYYNKTITQIDLPDKLCVISPSAFAFCFGLTGTLKIPDNVENIGESAFLNCQNIQQLHFGKNLKTIGSDAFFKVKSSVIEISAIIPPSLADDAFTDYSATLIVPSGRVQAYANASGWKNFKKITDDKDANVINPITSIDDSKPFDVYNLYGVCVMQNATISTLNHLSPGIYIVNGNKILIGSTNAPLHLPHNL